MKKVLMYVLVVCLSVFGMEVSAVAEGESTSASDDEFLIQFIEESKWKWENQNLEGALEGIGNVHEIEDKYISSRAIGDVYVMKGEAFYPETDNGANLYAFSTHTTDLQCAAGYFEIPTDIDLADETRVAYVSAGIAGLTHGIDLGIRNDGGNWHPYYYDGGHMFVSYDDWLSEAMGFVADESAVRAAFVVSPYSSNQVAYSVEFLDENNLQVGAFNSIIDVAEDNLSFIEDQAFVRFFRFVSLVHLDGAEDDQHDGSYLVDAGFSNLKVERYDGRKHDWGIETEWVEKAWIVSPERIQVYEREDGESVNINHW